MASDERLEQLERRLALLEEIVKHLAAGAERPPRPGAPADYLDSLRHRRSAPPASPSSTASTAPPDLTAPPASPPGLTADRELWLGQRGLLGAGVLGVVLAAGLLLKLAFDRGWISPFLRCLSGVLAGTAVGALGWRLEGRSGEMRRYGAGLIGTGAAIVYLAVWAAAKLYGLLPPLSGMLGLALVSVALAAIAYAVDIEALGAAAAAGAFLAPVVLGPETGRPDLLLIYTASLGAALGGVAVRKRWRLATALVALAVFGLGMTGPMARAHPWALWLYALLAGSAGLAVALKERWPETRFLAFAGGWALLAVANEHLAASWTTTLGGVVLAAPLWWRGWRATALWPFSGPGGKGEGRLTWAESAYFALTPLLLGWAVSRASPAAFAANQGLAAALVAIPYLLAGCLPPRPPFALVGSVALLLGAYLQWTGLECVVVALLVAHGWTELDQRQGRRDGRWYALLAVGSGLLYLLDRVPSPAASPPRAFVGGWPLTVWAMVVTLLVLAQRSWLAPAEQATLRRDAAIGVGLRVAGGACLFGGVTYELRRFFAQTYGLIERATLASGLAVSAWWVLFAAALVLLGFRRGVRPLRLAGLGVAGLAGLKVILVDLSELDALYRVGSVLTLGVVFLALAYLYHRRAL